jgi:hypothetical protein
VGVSEDAVAEASAKMRIEGVPGASSDGPMVIDIEAFLEDWLDI